MTEIDQIEGLPEQVIIPEKGLWAAVMMQAIGDIRFKPSKQRSGNAIYATADQHAYRTAREWILSERRDLFNSFLSVCDLLDINPGSVRALVK